MPLLRATLGPLEAEHLPGPCSRASEYRTAELQPLLARRRHALFGPFAAWLRATMAMELRFRRLANGALFALALFPCPLLLLAHALCEPARTPSLQHSECGRLCVEPVWQYWGLESATIGGNASAVTRTTVCDDGFGNGGVRLAALSVALGSVSPACPSMPLRAGHRLPFHAVQSRTPVVGFTPNLNPESAM